MAKTKRSVWVAVARYTSLAFVLPACVLVGYLIGHLLDRLFGTSFFYIIFLLVGIAAGFLELIREVQRDSGE